MGRRKAIAVFKNALCLAYRPEADWPGARGYSHCCKRHADHQGMHRVKYDDGYVYWNSGDHDSVLEAKR
jgi:hypothetical protein